MDYVKWEMKKDVNKAQLKDVGIDEIDAREITDSVYIETGEARKKDIGTLTKTTVICAITVHGRLYLEAVKGYVNGHGIFYCTWQEYEKHF